MTLGIYRFWAKVRIRRYQWDRTRYLGDRFEFTGTGKELFFGFLIALAFLFVLGGVHQALFYTALTYAPDLTWVLDTLLYLGLILLAGIAIYRARRYRLSRSQWRGIRGAQTGSAMKYGLSYLGYMLLTAVTLGLFWPFMSVRLAEYKLNNTWFGDRHLRFEGEGRDLFRSFFFAWLLFIPTLGLSAFWFRAASLRYFASHTRYENLRFSSEVRGGPLAWLIVSNLLISILSFGLAYPVVLVRSARFICGNLEITGEQDFARIAQSMAPLPATCEGLATVLDVGEF